MSCCWLRCWLRLGTESECGHARRCEADKNSAVVVTANAARKRELAREKVLLAKRCEEAPILLVDAHAEPVAFITHQPIACAIARNAPCSTESFVIWARVGERAEQFAEVIGHLHAHNNELANV